MDDLHDPDRRRRETFLTVLLAVLGSGALLFCLVLMTGGLFIWIVVGLAGVAALGLLNYLLWGFLFSRETSG